MTRNLKMLSLALAAVCVMNAVAASAASANVNYWLVAPGSDWTVLSGSQPEPFSDRFGVIGKTAGASGITKCETAAYSGSTSVTTATTMTLAAAYGSCELEPFGKSTVSMNECQYVIHTDPLGGSKGKYDTVTTIECPTGKEITIEAKIAGVLKCVIHIGPQALGTGIVLSNTAGGGLTATINFTTIKYTQTAGTGAGTCSTEATRSDGTFTGAATITGKTTGGASVPIAAEGEPEVEEFHSEAEDTTIIGEAAATEEFIVNAGTAKCTESVYKGTMKGKAASEVTLAPEYGGCTAFGFSSSEVKVNGCTYVFKSGEEVSGKREGKLDIACPEGKAIEIIAKKLGLTKCVITIGAQTGRTAVTYTNEGSGSTRDVKFDLSVTGLKYTQDVGEGLGKCSAGTFETGQYNGTATVIAENSEKKQVGFWVE